MNIIALIQFIAFEYWFVVAAPFIALGAMIVAFIGFFVVHIVKNSRILKGILTCLLVTCLLLLAGGMLFDWVSGPPEEIKQFDRATRDLDRMLAMVGNSDSEVIAVCADVESAYGRVDFSRVSKDQQSSMKSVMDGAKAWRIQLTTMKLLALQTQLGQDRREEITTNIEISRLLLPGIRLSIDGYLSKKYGAASEENARNSQFRPSVILTNPSDIDFTPPPPDRPNYYPPAIHRKSAFNKQTEANGKLVRDFYERQNSQIHSTTQPMP
jgi:hypothetical protein